LSEDIYENYMPKCPGTAGCVVKVSKTVTCRLNCVMRTMLIVLIFHVLWNIYTG